MKTYSSLNDLKVDYPKSVDMILRENFMQYRNAKFVIARTGSHCLDQNSNEIVALFDIGVDGELLYIWVACVHDDGGFIDEYYTMNYDEAMKQIDRISSNYIGK